MFDIILKQLLRANLAAGVGIIDKQLLSGFPENRNLLLMSAKEDIISLMTELDLQDGTDDAFILRAHQIVSKTIGHELTFASSVDDDLDTLIDALFHDYFKNPVGMSHGGKAVYLEGLHLAEHFNDSEETESCKLIIAISDTYVNNVDFRAAWMTMDADQQIEALKDHQVFVVDVWFNSCSGIRVDRATFKEVTPKIRKFVSFV